jgi:hypothetical protein
MVFILFPVRGMIIPYILIVTYRNYLYKNDLVGTFFCVITAVLTIGKTPLNLGNSKRHKLMCHFFYSFHHIFIFKLEA